jgi:hypothetical protein
MNIKLEEPPADGEIKPRPPLSPPIQGGRPKLEVLELEEVVVERKLSLPLSLAFGKDPNNNGGSGGAGASANTNHNCLPSATAVRAAPIINHQRRHTEVGKLNGKI